MENTYGIGVTNRYALFLDDESDPLETLKLKEQEKELKKKTKVAEKENKSKTEPPAKAKTSTGQKKTAKDNANNKTQDNGKRDDNKLSHQRSSNPEGKPDRGFNKFNNENREDRNNRRNRDDRERTFNGSTENRERDRDREERPPRRENAGENNFENRNRGGRPLNNKPGGAKGPRRPFDDRRGKREFDRQSGSDKTGVKPVDKRDGAGAHNWGSHKDVIEEADKTTNDADQSWNEGEKIEQPPPLPAPEQKEETETEQTPVEEEPKELTLDEWKAQRAGRQKPQYNIRKAGEGEDLTQWKKMYELRKKENEEHQDTDDEEFDVTAEYPQRVGRQKHLLEIDIQFNDPRRSAGGRGRGPRPGGTGPRSGNRNNPRGPATGERSEGGGGGAGRRFREEQGGEERAENKRAPKVDDEKDFPSLG